MRGWLATILAVGCGRVGFDEALRVEAQIDGRSRLHITGNVFQWEHLDYVAPGRSGSVALPTKLDDFEWYPIWPDLPDVRNRSCVCMSDTASISAELPLAPATVTITPIRVREMASVVQQPTGENSTTVIDFDDGVTPGWDTYIIDVNFVP